MTLIGPVTAEHLRLKYRKDELEGMRRVIEFLWDGNQEAFSILYFVKANYKEWRAIMVWLKNANIRGAKLVALFQNESPDGGGYHMGATYILSRIKGLKHGIEGIKIDELL